MAAQPEDRTPKLVAARVVPSGAAESEERAAQPREPRVERVLARLAGRQHGVVSRAQLLAAGLTRHEIEHRLAVGALIPLHRGVYSVGHLALTALSHRQAAVLASGPGSALSFLTAAVHLELLPPGQGPIHVSKVGPRRDARPGLVLHHATSLETTCRRGIRVTTPHQTLLDLAATAGDRDLAKAMTEARVRRLVDEAALLTSAVRRPGAERLRDLLAHAPQPTRSEAENRLLALVAKAGLPRPRTNVRVRGHEVDVLWPEHRLVAEVDGYAYHGHRQAFERDRRRAAALAAAGYRVIRLTWRQLTREPEAVLVRLAQALAVSTDRVG